MAGKLGSGIGHLASKNLASKKWGKLLQLPIKKVA